MEGHWVTIGSIITIVTAIVVYFQTVHTQGMTFRFFPEVPLILIFAAMNSFTEEVLFRLSYTTIIANEKMNPKVSEIISALVFGGVHYFGIAPSGVAGAIMAAFIGWFLAKSINETKGFFGLGYPFCSRCGDIIFPIYEKLLGKYPIINE